MSLDPASTSAQANDLGANWCVGTTAFSAIGFGTPGAANDVCPVAPPDAGVVDTGVVPDAGDLDGGVVPDGGVVQDGGTPTATGLIINEVDYDQPGTDTTEFVELYNAGTAPVDLTNVAVVTVNGSNNTEYGRYALSGSLAAGAYLVLGNAAVVVPGGVTFVTLPANGMQNGAPDAVALIDTASNTLLDALSYEGGMTSVTITGFAGPVSLVRGTAVTETDITDGSLSRLPNGAFSGDDDTDWTFTTTPTPGAANQ